MVFSLSLSLFDALFYDKQFCKGNSVTQVIEFGGAGLLVMSFDVFVMFIAPFNLDPVCEGISFLDD